MPVPTRAIASVAALDDPVRAALYELISNRHPAPVGRNQAATELAIGRSLAAFHLDRLVAAGLLQTTFQRPPGRGGPGAGRPAKLYSRSPDGFEISLPRRDYQLAARVMLGALTDPSQSLARAAWAHGRALGSAVPGRRSPKRRLLDLLGGHGYEPVAVAGGALRLRNCPFDALTGSDEKTVCELNLSLLEGMIEGARIAGFRAELAPEPGFCCVTVRRNYL